MQPGIDAVEAAPGMSAILTVLLIAALASLASLIIAAYSERWGRAILSGTVLGVVVAGGAVYTVPRFEEWQQVYDYDATWARLEARYGVELSEGDKETRLPGPAGRHPGGILDQDALDEVVMPDGTVRDDLYLQYAKGERARVAIVTRPAGANPLLVTRGAWWDEIALAQGAPSRQTGSEPPGT